MRAVTLILGGIAVAGLLAAGHFQRDRDRLASEREGLVRDRDAAWAVVKAEQAEREKLHERSRDALKTVTAQVEQRDRRWTRAMVQAGRAAADAGRWKEAAVLLCGALERREGPELRFAAARAVGEALAAPIVSAVALELPTSLRTLTARDEVLAGIGRDDAAWSVRPATRRHALDVRGGLAVGDAGALLAIDAAGRLRGSGGTLSLQLSGHDGGVTALAAADGRIATGDRAGGLRVWTEAGKLERELDTAQGWILDLAFSEDGRLASAGRDGSARIYDGEGRAVQVLKGHRRWARSLTFAPGGRLLAVGDGAGAIHLWESRRGVKLVVLRGHRGAVTGLAWHAGRLVSLGGDGGVLSWDAVALLAPAVELAGRAARTGLRLDGLRAIPASGDTAPGGSGR